MKQNEKKQSRALSTTINRIVRDWNINECQLNALTSLATAERRQLMWEPKIKIVFKFIFRCTIKISNESEIKFILFIVPVVISASVPPFSKWGRDSNGDEKKHVVCYCWAQYCLLVDVKHFHMYSQHTLYYSAKICTNAKFAARFVFRADKKAGGWRG